MKTPFQKNITVTQDDIDGLNHVNNVRYVQWIQDVAVDHWRSATKDKISKKYIWVVASHHIEYKSSALLNEVLTLETYVKSFSTSTSHRVVEIRNAKTNKICVKALTVWCLVNPETMRPMAIPREILEIS